MWKHLSKITSLFAAALVLLVFTATPVVAQSNTAQEGQNLKMVLGFWREVLVAGHVELASKYMAEGYIQHNPNVPTGRAGFVKYFGGRPARPIPATLPNPPIKTFAQGDYVVLVWEHEAPDPADSSKTYKYNTFDVFRVTNGKIEEHWDSAMKNPPAPQK
jgi:predicted SnoaL-like aldol condensation-catalyzing enzyme